MLMLLKKRCNRRGCRISRGYNKIAEYSEKISVPVYVKEVGHGISFEVASALRGTSIKAIDVQGAGGTSWTAVDALRHKEGFGLIFRDFGLPTAVSLIETKTALSGTDKKVIASGGIRNGLEAVSTSAWSRFVWKRFAFTKSSAKKRNKRGKRIFVEFQERNANNFLLNWVQRYKRNTFRKSTTLREIKRLGKRVIRLLVFIKNLTKKPLSSSIVVN